MNILCKIFFHRMYFDTGDVLGPTHCVRWKCEHKEKARKWPRPPMPKCKPPKESIVSDSKPPDKFHYHEYIDRVDSARTIIEELLDKHHLGWKYRKDTDMINSLLGELYNKVTNDSDELFKDK